MRKPQWVRWESWKTSRLMWGATTLGDLSLLLWKDADKPWSQHHPSIMQRCQRQSKVAWGSDSSLWRSEAWLGKDRVLRLPLSPGKDKAENRTGTISQPLNMFGVVLPWETRGSLVLTPEFFIQGMGRASPKRDPVHGICVIHDSKVPQHQCQPQEHTRSWGITKQTRCWKL